MTRTFIVPIKDIKINDLLIRGLLDVKKYAKSRAIFSDNDRILCHFKERGELFGPLYVSNAKVQKYIGDVNDLQIECEIREKVYLFDYNGPDELVSIDEGEYETLFKEKLPPENNYLPSITGDYELDGILSMPEAFKDRYRIRFSSDTLFDYAVNKMKQTGLNDFKTRKKEIVIPNANVSDTIFTHFDGFIDNQVFYKGLLLSLIKLTRKAEVGSIDEKYNYLFHIDNVIEEITGPDDNINNTLYPTIKTNQNYVLSGMCRWMEPFKKMLSDATTIVEEEPAPIVNDEKCQVPDKLRFDLSLILVRRMLTINGYAIRESEDVDQLCTLLHLVKNDNDLDLYVVRDLPDCPTDLTTRIQPEDLILILRHEDRPPSIVKGTDYKESVEKNNPHSLESKKIELRYERLNLKLNWVKSDFSNQLSTIWRT